MTWQPEGQDEHLTLQEAQTVRLSEQRPRNPGGAVVLAA